MGRPRDKSAPCEFFPGAGKPKKRGPRFRGPLYLVVGISLVGGTTLLCSRTLVRYLQSVKAM